MAEPGSPTPGDLPDGTEVEAHGLRNSVELNGARGYTVGKQRAPDGTVLIAVRLERGEIRLFHRANLRGSMEGPMPNLTGAWGCWFGSTHVFHHEGNRLTVVDSSTGDVYQGTVSRDKAETGPSLQMKVLRAQHQRGWMGPLDDEPQPVPLDSPPRKKIVYPWYPKKKKPVLSMYIMGTIGVFDGESITWKSGTVWRRVRAEETSKLAVAHPAIPLAGIPDSPGAEHFSI